MKKTIPSFLILLLIMMSCNQASPDNKVENAPDQKEASAPVADNSRSSLDWSGTYTGTVPCADCEGIETTLTLNTDNMYVLKKKYKGKSDEVFEKTGNFSWNSAGSAVILSGIDDGPSQYQVGENILFQLDMNGNRITGELSDKYQLKKIQ